MAGRSRWLVGSSRTSRLTPRCWSRASAARVRSPGESESHGRVTCSPPSPNFASSVRASVGSISPTPGRRAAMPASVGASTGRAGSVRAQNTSSSGVGPEKAARAWSTRPGSTPAPVDARPSSGSTRPVRSARSVDLPAPLGPPTRTRSPASRRRETGPRRNSPRVTTAPSHTATTVPDLGAAATCIRSSHSLRGSATSSRRSIARSVCEIFPACFSVRWPARCRMCLSRSRFLPPVMRIADRTPLSSHVFCV